MSELQPTGVKKWLAHAPAVAAAAAAARSSSQSLEITAAAAATRAELHLRPARKLTYIGHLPGTIVWAGRERHINSIFSVYLRCTEMWVPAGGHEFCRIDSGIGKGKREE